MFHTIVKAFKAVDSFLTQCEEYNEERVWNGKFIVDLKFLSVSTFDHLSESIKKHHHRLITSNGYTQTQAFFIKLAGLFMQFDVVADTIHLISEGFRIYFKYFAHFLIALVANMGITYLLFTLFKNAPAHFVVLLLPLLFANHLFFSSFFCLVEKKEQGLHLLLSDLLNQLKQTLPATIFIFFLQNSLVSIAGVFFVGFAFLISTIFASMNIAWSSSFFYWLPVVTIGLILIVLTHIFEIILSFAYTFALHERKTAVQALQQSYSSIHHKPRYSFFFYLLLTVFAGAVISILSTTNYEGGFMVSLLITNHVFLMLGFLLRRRYFRKDIPNEEAFIDKISHFAKLIIGIGIFSYISGAALFLQIQPQILTYFKELRPTIATTQKYSIYQNKGYTINYPQSWSLYRWNENSITISTNDTGTIPGSVKVQIETKSLDDSDYRVLYEANPGLLEDNADSKNVTTKIANTVINKHNAVKYTYTKIDTEQTEFQTHYLVLHGNTVYDIALITYSIKKEAAYMKIFEIMVQSFMILPE